MWIPNPTALRKSIPRSLQNESHAVSSSETRLILHRQREGELGAAELADGDAFLLDAELMKYSRYIHAPPVMLNHRNGGG